MKRRLNPPVAIAPSPEAAVDAGEVLQVKVWLVGISPMVWRRVLVPATYTLRELHGVVQGWPWAGTASTSTFSGCERRVTVLGGCRRASADVTLANLRFRKRARLIYEYDLNIPWRHEVRVEDRLEREVRKTYPVCAGAAAPARPRIAAVRRASWTTATTGCHSRRLKTWTPWSRFSRTLCRRTGQRRSRSTGRRWRLEDAVERARAREETQGRPFSRRDVNVRLRAGEHHTLMHQQW